MTPPPDVTALDHDLDAEAAAAVARELDGLTPSPFYPAALDDTAAGPWPLTARQDDLEGLGGPAPGAPRTPAEALATARRFAADSVYVGVGYCLKTVRTFYGVPALYPDAETAWEEAEQQHPTSDPKAIPRGVPVWWTNGRYGHVALSAGGGMCWTTDYRRTGYVNLAPIGPLAAWCGGRLVGWTEDVNGVDVWNPKPTKPAPVFDRADRLKVVTRALERAQANGAPRYRVEGLRAWARQIDANLKENPA